MNKYKTTTPMTDAEMNKAFMGNLGKANANEIYLTACFGFNHVPAYLLVEMDNDPGTLFPDLTWESLDDEVNNG